MRPAQDGSFTTLRWQGTSAEDHVGQLPAGARQGGGWVFTPLRRRHHCESPYNPLKKWTGWPEWAAACKEAEEEADMAAELEKMQKKHKPIEGREQKISRFFGPLEAFGERLCDVCGTKQDFQMRAKCCNMICCHACAGECIWDDQKCYRCPEVFK